MSVASPPRTIELELRGVAIVRPERGAGRRAVRRGLAGWLGWSRRLCAAYGVLGLVAMGLVDGLGLARAGERLDALALTAFTALAVAVLTGGVEVLLRGRAAAPAAEVEEARIPRPSRRAWLLASLAVAAGAAAVVQAWYHGVGPLLAGGDIAPPAGTAWTSQTWDAFGWTGWDVGSPGQYQGYLPWIAVLRVVTGLGGSLALAQQLFYTLLFAGAALACLSLLRVLGLRPVGAAVGAAVYVLNPYTVTAVGINPVFLCGLVLLATTLALVIGAGLGRLHPLLAAGLLALTAPLWGYAWLNPPLVGMVLIAALASPLVALWLGGRRAALRSALTLVVGLPLLVLASSYWLVVGGQRLSLADSGSLSADSSWLWTEGRSTLPNAFWLNTSWGWAHAEYFPYASVFEQFPLALLKFALPATAFLALLLRERRGRPRGGLTVVVVAAAASLAVVLLSTGTNEPGAALFLPLYHLPYGWLLREPGRFLMVAGLGYGVLIGTLADRAAPFARRGTSPAQLPRWRGAGLRLRRAAVLGLAAAVITGPAYPLVAGAVVADDRPGLPPSHVAVPAYWTEMAATIDALPDPGAVAVLPADDFYQMPYTWGYYGTDSFIEQLVHHHLLTPSVGGYSSVSQTLVAGIQDTEQALVANAWTEARRVLAGMDATYVLVRDDIDANYPRRHITPPAAIAAALERDPDATLVAHRGALELYHVDTRPAADMAAVPDVVTVDSPAPDLAMRALLPDGAHLAVRPPLPGAAAVAQLPPLAQWSLQGDTLVAASALPPGRDLAVAVLGGPARRAAQVPAAAAAELLPGLSITGDPASGQVRARLQLGAERIAGGDFAQGGWGEVGDCYAVLGGAAAALRASVITGAGPAGASALRISSGGDSACAMQDAGIGDGPLLVSFDVRHVAGAPPRACLWEFAAKRCADMPDVPMTSAWTRFQAVVQPAAGSRLALYLYADGPFSGPRSIDDYANVSVRSLAAARTVAVIAAADVQAGETPVLFEHLQGFGKWWTGPRGYTHVAVDGLFDGWLAAAGSPAPLVTYAYGSGVRLSYAASAGAALLLILLFAGFAWRRARERRRRRDWGLS